MQTALGSNSSGASSPSSAPWAPIRTVSGVARSLGLPAVSIRPAPGSAAVVNVVVAWELSWYRYEVDLAEEMEPVRIGAQGAELGELAPEELEPNAVCTPDGYLALA